MEIWNQWKPAKELSGRYKLENILWEDASFKISITNQNNSQKITINFNDYIEAVRHNSKKFNFTIPSDFAEKLDREPYKDWSFFKVENSEYLQWMSEKSGGWSDRFGLVHFCFVLEEDIIDVAVTYEPIINIQ